MKQKMPIALFLIISNLILMPGCKKDPKKVLAHYERETQRVRNNYADEARLLDSIEKKRNLSEAKKDETLNAELKKIALFKCSNARCGFNPYGGPAISAPIPFLHYKNCVAHDMENLREKIALVRYGDWKELNTNALMHDMEHMLTMLDIIYNHIYLDMDVVRDFQMACFSDQLNNRFNEIERLIRAKDKQSVVVVMDESD